MPERDRRHPDIIFLKLRAGDGFGFTFLSRADYLRAAEALMKPAAKAQGIDLTDPEARQKLAYDYLWRYFFKPEGKVFQRDNVRWIAAAAVIEKYGVNGPVPQIVKIERNADGGIVISSADEFLKHPGFPLAVVVGKPAKGGGKAHFFASKRDYEAAGSQGLTDAMWLPQIVFRLYETTPTVVMGMPKSGAEGKMAVECRALAFGRKAKLVERKHA
ncbi:MAG: hypothetical protein FJX59_05735 [Alphaproteobacteria bacterium]|nr:hypothetical protein [Alphaproteobacteria bacterium]